MSVVTKSEGPRIEITEGRSEGPVIGLGIAKLSFEGATVGAEGVAEACRGRQDFARAASDLGVFGGGVDVESRMFETEGTLEREQRGIGEIHDERFGCEEEPMELPAGHRFRAVERRKPKADPMDKRNPVIPGPTHLSRTVRFVTTCGPIWRVGSPKPIP